MEQYFIYINSFWPGFIDKTDTNNIDYFEKIFINTKLKNFIITHDINKANVLFESVFGESLLTYKKWDYTIKYSGEPFNNSKNFNISLDSEYNTLNNNIIDLPLCVYYINSNNFLYKLITRTYINKIPTKFCCFIVSNGSCEIRNKMFSLLNLYKKVDSFGGFANNMNRQIEYPYWSENFFNFIGQYKFIICFENTKKGTYITEKIINPYLAKIIPIYWGTHHIKNIFNDESFLFLEDETDEAYVKLINKIIELDNDNTKYLNIINTPVFTSKNLDYWNNNYTNEIISKNIDEKLMRII
jgi:hypothetical protein